MLRETLYITHITRASPKPSNKSSQVAQPGDDSKVPPTRLLHRQSPGILLLLQIPLPIQVINRSIFLKLRLKQIVPPARLVVQLARQPQPPQGLLEKGLGRQALGPGPEPEPLPVVWVTLIFYATTLSSNSCARSFRHSPIC